MCFSLNLSGIPILLFMEGHSLLIIINLNFTYIVPEVVLNSLEGPYSFPSVYIQCHHTACVFILPLTVTTPVIKVSTRGR